MRTLIRLFLLLSVVSWTVCGQPITATLSFGGPTVPLNGSTTLTLSSSNTSGLPVVSASVTAFLPAGLVVSTPNGLVTSCPNATAIAGSNQVMIGTSGYGAGGSCAVMVNVTGTTLGPKVAQAIVSTGGGSDVVTAFVTVVDDPLPVAAPVAVEASGVYQLRYLSNLIVGDSYVNLTNAGVLDGFDPAGRICVNVYTFDPSEEMVSCCACLVTPDGLVALSAQQDLLSRPLTPGMPNSVTVKLLSTIPNGNICNPSSPATNPTNLVKGMKAWATTLHQNTSNGSYVPSDTEFTKSDLSESELRKLTTYCGFIQANGSGFGLCKSCRLGGLGGAQR